MIFVFGLLLESLVDSWALDPGQNLRCALEQRQFLVTWGRPEWRNGALANTGTIMDITILLWILGSGYVRSIQGLYRCGSQDFPRKWQILLLSVSMGRTSLSDQAILVAKQKFKSTICGNESWLKCFIILESFNWSLIFEVIWLIFYYIAGLLQVIYYLGDKTGIGIEPSFGQLLPLILMFLLFLSMLEGYSGENIPMKFLHSLFYN
jgi:hypothetical protein